MKRPPIKKTAQHRGSNVRRFGEPEAAFDRVAYKAELEREMDAEIASLVAILDRVNPLPLIALCFARNCMGDPETTTEPEHEGREVEVEYALSLATARPSWSSAAPSEEDEQAFLAGVSSVVDRCVLWLSLGETNDDPGSEFETTRFMGRLRHLLQRGSGVIEHETDLLREVFADHDPLLRKHGRPTTEDVIALSIGQMEKFNATVRAVGEAMMPMRELALRCQEAVASLSETEREEALAALRDGPVGDAARAAAAAIPSIEDAIKVEGSPELLKSYRHLALAPGENAAFYERKAFRGWPTTPSLVHSRPLLAHSGQLYTPSPVLVLRQRATALSASIKACNTDYYGNQFARKRGKTAERLAVKYLGALLPSATFCESVRYNEAIENGTRQFETDAIAVLDDILFIVEVKSAPLKEESLRGAQKTLQDDLGHLVDAPYAQAIRTLEHIRSREESTFLDERGHEVLVVRAASIKRVYLITVTLADVGHVTARLPSARGMGLLVGDVWPWAVHINDLRVISELAGSTTEFLLYLERRLATNGLKQLQLQDELDHFGWFLHNGLYFKPGEYSKFNMVAASSFTVDIDRYYDHQAGRVSSGAKPALKLSPFLRSLIAAVECSDSGGRYRAATDILSLSSSEHDRIEDWFEGAKAQTLEDGQPHSITLQGRDLPILVLYTCPSPSDALTRQHMSYCEAKSAQTGNRSVHLIALHGFEPLEAKLWVVERAGAPGPRARRAAVELAAEKLIRYFEEGGATPGRNEMCPCGSARKFKRCCIDRAPLLVRAKSRPTDGGAPWSGL